MNACCNSCVLQRLRSLVHYSCSHVASERHQCGPWTASAAASERHQCGQWTAPAAARGQHQPRPVNSTSRRQWTAPVGSGDMYQGGTWATPAAATGQHQCGPWTAPATTRASICDSAAVVRELGACWAGTSLPW